MSLRLAINARYLHRRITGVDRYAHEVSKRLGISKRSIQPSHALGQVSGHAWEQLILPGLIQTGELLWSPANAGPWRVPHQVLTLHDASVFDHPEWFKPSFAAWTRLSWKILAAKVEAVITISEFSKKRLQHHLGISNGKIHVIRSGVGQPFEPQPEKHITAVKEKYGIRKPYFLFVGTAEPRKNLHGLISAWKELNLKTHELVLSGMNGHVFRSSHAIQTTYIPDEDLPAIYSGAAALVLPSSYEGFGLPALEAMACGAPTITSNTTALGEIFSDSSLQISPDKPVEIAHAMQAIIEDKTLARSLREKGLQKANHLTWEKSAAATHALLESVS